MVLETAEWARVSSTQRRQYVRFMCAYFAVCYIATITIPYWYDHGNYAVYQGTTENNRSVIIREFRTEHIDSQAPNGLSGAVIISLDYHNQLERFAAINSVTYFGLSGVFLLFAVLTFGGVLVHLHKYFTRSIALMVAFVAPVLALGLLSIETHFNYKFHLVVAPTFGLLFAAIDLMRTYPSKLPQDGFGTPAYLAHLQYRHRYWSMVFAASLTFMIAAFATVSFNLLGFLLSVFGESFVIRPLAGTVFIGILFFVGVVGGLLWSIRVHLSDLEDAMLRPLLGQDSSGAG